MSSSTNIQLYIILIVFQEICTINVTVILWELLQLSRSFSLSRDPLGYCTRYFLQNFTGSRPKVHEAFKHSGNFISHQV
jgi:hypothetical protein